MKSWLPVRLKRVHSSCDCPLCVRIVAMSNLVGLFGGYQEATEWTNQTEQTTHIGQMKAHCLLSILLINLIFVSSLMYTVLNNFKAREGRSCPPAEELTFLTYTCYAIAIASIACKVSYVLMKTIDRLPLELLELLRIGWID